MKKSKCVLFCRVSSSTQDWERQYESLYRKARYDDYSDEEIITIGHKESGYNLDEDERKGLEELYKELKSGEVACVYVWELSRLARRPNILYEIRDKFKEYEVQLKCEKPSFTLLDKDLKAFDSNAMLVFSIFTALAEQEIFLKKERFADGKKRNAMKGRYNGGYIPFGYYVKDDKTFGVIDEKKAIIKDIFDWYEEGYSVTNIVKKLKEEHHEEGVHFTLSFVQNILTSEHLTGEWNPLVENEAEKDKDKVITVVRNNKKQEWHLYKRTYEPVITKEQFLHCRAIAKANNTNADKTRNIYFANKIFRCPLCGRYMVGVANRCIYRCYDAYNTNRTLEGYPEETRCKNRKNYSINVVDTILWHSASFFETKKMIINKREQKERYKDQQEQAENKLVIANERIEKKLEKLDRIRDDYYDGNVDKAGYERRRNATQQEINDIKADCLKYENEIEQYKQLIEQLEIDSTYKKELQGRSNIGFINSEHWKEFMKAIEIITDDDKRYDIVHRNIKSLEVEEKEIIQKFQKGVKLIKIKIYTVCSYDEQKLYFYVNSNSGRGAAIYVKAHPIHTSSHFQLTMEPDIPVIQRYDNIKRTKERAKKKAEKQEQKAQRREGKFTIKELMKLSGYGYAKIHYAIAHNRLKAEKDGNEFVVAKKDWENFYKE